KDTVPALYISFVIPVMNEVGNVAQLHAEIVAAAEKIGQAFEIIFIDDGSSDGTYEALRELKPITIVRMRRNFGQTTALQTGIQTATGQFLVTLDGDRQNDP